MRECTALEVGQRKPTAAEIQAGQRDGMNHSAREEPERREAGALAIRRASHHGKAAVSHVAKALALFDVEPPFVQ